MTNPTPIFSDLMVQVLGAPTKAPEPKPAPAAYDLLNARERREVDTVLAAVLPPGRDPHEGVARADLVTEAVTLAFGLDTEVSEPRLARAIRRVRGLRHLQEG